MKAQPAIHSSRSEAIAKAHRIVIKLGTAVLINDKGGVALSRFYSLVESVTRLRQSGREVLLVSSGAIGLGSERLGLTLQEQLLQEKQACAAVGQSRLMALYSDAFDRVGLTT